MKNVRRFQGALGPLEQAQIVASTAVVVAMVTIVMARIFSGYKLGWFDFVSVITVGIFGFLIVFFTLKYGRLLEEQKQELLALNTLAEAVNRAVEINLLLESALLEVKRSLDLEDGWIYLVEGNRLVLKNPRTMSPSVTSIISSGTSLEDELCKKLRIPRIEQAPSRLSRSRKKPWTFDPHQSWASVPIMIKESFSGVIMVASDDRKGIDEKKLQLMTGFANQIGVALENAALFERVRQSEERYIDLFENSPDMYHIVNREGIIISCNRTEADRLGYRKDKLVGHSLLMLYPASHHDSVDTLIKKMIELRREVKDVEQQMVTSSGELIDVSVNSSLILDETGRPVLIRSVSRDITEKKKMEAKILHAQRIDSIGNLAGGVAHDFNNVLTSILGSTAIMKKRMTEEDPWYRFADIIETAAKRGASLTRQLLTFARKGTVQFKPVIVNSIIVETLHLFERSIDKTIVVENRLSPRIGIVKGDEGQIQQAILNILINARDAMPEGGTITIVTDITDFNGQSGAEMRDRSSGKFVSITITDTGIGMDREIQQRIFEPFFTTKDQGKGTGLGLSVVYGVVNAHDGFITMRSAVGQGSTFSIYLPLLKEREALDAEPETASLSPGTERVLVVDDESHVGEVIAGMLTELGYNVKIARGGREAIELVEHDGSFNAVVLDMNMPEMGGKETFFRLKELNPSLRIIVSTGYSNTSIESSPLQNSIDGFLQKPYQLQELSRVLHEVFGRSQERAP